MDHVVVFLAGFVLGALAVLGIVHHIKRRVTRSEFDRIWRGQFRGIVRGLNPSFSETIRCLSPSFCDIYDQAAQAEAYYLYDICGIGYGKGLEFLVKDLAKSLHPTDSEAIERTPLGQCIQRYIDEPLIRDSAQLGAWLRNDEAHYKRRYENKDAKDLRELIGITVALVEEAARRRSFDKRLGEIRKDLAGP
jgi:hypothetical protein